MVDRFCGGNIYSQNIYEMINSNNCIEIPVVFSNNREIDPLEITEDNNGKLLVQCSHYGLVRYVLAQHLYFKNSSTSRIQIIIMFMHGLIAKQPDSTSIVRILNNNKKYITRMWVLLKHLQQNKLCFIINKKQA